jgi:hypothetical protein
MKNLFSKFILMALTIGSLGAQAGNWESERLHSYERAIYFPNLLKDFDNTSMIVFDLQSMECLDRIQISAETITGSPVMFLIGGAANNPEPLSQDIHAGTVTLPAARLDPHYPFRIRQMSSQVMFLVGGGAVRVLAARAVIVPKSFCNQ